MTTSSVPLKLLMLMYLILSIIAVWYSVVSANINLLALGVIPTVIGLMLKAPWANILMKIYVVLQTIGFAALGITAILAYQISPADTNVIVAGQPISIPWLAVVIVAWLCYQYWVAFSQHTQQYLHPQLRKTH